MNLVGARRDVAADMESRSEVDTESEVGQAFINRPAAQTAGRIAENFAGLDDREPDTRFAKPAAKLEVDQQLFGLARVVGPDIGCSWFGRGFAVRLLDRLFQDIRLGGNR